MLSFTDASNEKVWIAARLVAIVRQPNKDICSIELLNGQHVDVKGEATAICIEINKELAR